MCVVRLLFVVCCLWFAVCCLRCVVCCLWFVAFCSLIAAICMGWMSPPSPQIPKLAYHPQGGLIGKGCLLACAFLAMSKSIVSSAKLLWAWEGTIVFLASLLLTLILLSRTPRRQVRPCFPYCFNTEFCLPCVFETHSSEVSAV